MTIKNGFSPRDFTPQRPSQSSHHLAQPCVRGAGLVHTSILSDSEASHVMVVVVGVGLTFSLNPVLGVAAKKQGEAPGSQARRPSSAPSFPEQDTPSWAGFAIYTLRANNIYLHVKTHISDGTPITPIWC